MLRNAARCSKQCYNSHRHRVTPSHSELLGISYNRTKDRPPSAAAAAADQQWAVLRRYSVHAPHHNRPPLSYRVRQRCADYRNFFVSPQFHQNICGRWIPTPAIIPHTTRDRANNVKHIQAEIRNKTKTKISAEKHKFFVFFSVLCSSIRLATVIYSAHICILFVSQAYSPTWKFLALLRTNYTKYRTSVQQHYTRPEQVNL